MSTFISGLMARASEQDAAQAAFHKSTVESWTLYAFGVAATILRTYARGNAVGYRNLRSDDYLVWVGVLFYTAQTALAYSVGKSANGLANSGMTDAQRAALSVDDPEYRFRVIGSKIQLAGWTTYSALIWALKLSMLCFYVRLTDGLGKRYRVPVWVGFGLVVGTFIASIITILGACRPIHKYWQINPDPGNVCQAGVSKPIVWVSFAANVSTDLYLIFIPIPMLWKSSLKPIKKIASTIVLSTGIFVLVCATLKSVFVLVEPIDGAQLSASWGTREAFAAVITTNLPMIFHILRIWLSKVFGSAFYSTGQTYKTPSGGFKTIGGGAYGESQSRSNRRGPASHPNTINMTFTESEERMMNEEIKMQNLKAFDGSSAAEAGHAGGNGDVAAGAGGIVVSNRVEVTSEDRRSSHNSSEPPAERVHETW
ncbi:hypothetical protein P170DRAFT_455637 [Aspergillus steynii IBT 23096]|uniref:Rhodopsin domain-containing protein n=1 Tax=Aspergillus steynii IBT 23096 TaxID=1392250 RepID=A0A2I2G7C1_9EURO|nr:uncharacterized protein P170DRAFT_455637 [Aspergillus steynii IBT 23096]PLB48751.1 hypothetical protein P170DRAFT_455637 [Aspergillus steynii IBT 23096]